MNKERFDYKYLIFLLIIIQYLILLMNTRHEVFILTKPYLVLFIPILILEVIIADILYKKFNIFKNESAKLTYSLMLANFISAILALLIGVYYESLIIYRELSLLILGVFTLSFILPLIIEPLIIFLFIEKKDLPNFLNIFRLSGILNICSYLFILIITYYYLILF
jgi:hypothetical protein